MITCCVHCVASSSPSMLSENVKRNCSKGWLLKEKWSHTRAVIALIPILFESDDIGKKKSH